MVTKQILSCSVIDCMRKGKSKMPHSEQHYNLLANFENADIDLLEQHPQFQSLEDLLLARQIIINVQGNASNLVRLLSTSNDYEQAKAYWLTDLESVVDGNLICTMDNTIKGIIAKMESEVGMDADLEEDEIEKPEPTNDDYKNAIQEEVTEGEWV